MVHEHIIKSFDEELEYLQEKLLLMGGHAAAQLDAAVNALIGRDRTWAESIVKKDTIVDGLGLEVDRLTVRMLALRQPLGIDLRSILSALKIATDLERIADYAANIAKCVEGLNATTLIDPVDSIVRMTQVAKTMLEDVLQAYSKSDIKLAIDVWHRDDLIDKVYGQLLSQLRNSMKQDAMNIDPCTTLIFAGRSVERIGDHITNIAEHIYFKILGEDFPVS
ncbi:MAG: phosphate signaling complex protein PhoU [Syntrophobacteraceae bacterium]